MRDGARRRLLGALGLAVLGTAGCVTYDVAADPTGPIELTGAEPVVVPLHPGAQDATGQALDAWYESVVAQLQMAYVDREADVLQGLLLRHDRDSAPDWARQQLAVYRQLLIGLRVEEHLAGAARIRDVAPGQVLGDTVELELVVDSAPIDVVLPATVDDVVVTQFLFEVVVRDEDAFGNVTTRVFSEFVGLDEPAALGRGVLRVPFRVRRIAPEGVRRTIDVDCELMPGRFLLDGETVPSRRVPLARTTLVHWPPQVENVAVRPLETLRVALDEGGPERLRYVYVAAHFVPPEQVDTAVDLLIRNLRVAPPATARVDTVALRRLTGVDLPIGDRDAWLAWWQERRR